MEMLSLCNQTHSVFRAGVTREWVGFSVDLAAMDDGLLIGFLHGLAHIGLFVLHQLGLVKVRIYTQRLQLLPRQPLPATHNGILSWLIVAGVQSGNLHPVREMAQMMNLPHEF